MTTITQLKPGIVAGKTEGNFISLILVANNRRPRKLTIGREYLIFKKRTQIKLIINKGA